MGPSTSDRVSPTQPAPRTSAPGPPRRLCTAPTSIRPCRVCRNCARRWPTITAGSTGWTWTGRARWSSPRAPPKPWPPRSWPWSPPATRRCCSSRPMIATRPRCARWAAFRGSCGWRLRIGGSRERRWKRSSVQRPGWWSSTIPRIRRRASMRRANWSCWPTGACATTSSPSVTRSGSTWCSTAAATSRCSGCRAWPSAA